MLQRINTVVFFRVDYSVRHMTLHSIKQEFGNKCNLIQLDTTQHNFRPNIFLKCTEISFENNAFPKIKIILRNFKYVILGRI